MSGGLLAFFLIALSFQSFFFVDAFIWPMPQASTNGSESYGVCSSNFQFQVNIQSATVTNAIARFNEYLSMAPDPKHAVLYPTNSYANINAAAICSGTMTITSADETLGLNTNESYTLLVGASAVVITAETVYGAMYALTTLSQLIMNDTSKADANMIENGPWTVTDKPVFKHRGVLLDSARNWLSVQTILNVLKGMALTKLNVFHWHLIDATSFPFYSKSHPELSEKGAYSASQVYMPADITNIVEYGKARGVRVICELDTPGHTFAISYGDPQIMMCDAVEDNYGAMCPEPPCGYLDVRKGEAQQVIEDVFADAFELFPDKYFHIGADEVKSACWGANTTAMFTQWIKTFATLVNTNGRTPMLWSGNVDVGADIGQNSFPIVMQVWDNAADKETALKNGYKVVDSIYTAYYLDCGFGNWLSGGKSWCDPYKSWSMIYNHSLTAGIAQQYWGDILGGEVCLWGESVDDNNVYPRLWPRASAAAERWWIDRALTPSNLNAAFLRIAQMRDWMVGNGIVSSPSQPAFCTAHPEYCDYYRDTFAAEKRAMHWKYLLADYGLDIFEDAFEDHGWVHEEYWDDMTASDLEVMGLKRGHVNSFDHLLDDKRRLRR